VCAACPAGRYKSTPSANDCTPVDAGYYLFASGLTSFTGRVICPARSYCPAGASTPLSCPTGVCLTHPTHTRHRPRHSPSVAHHITFTELHHAPRFLFIPAHITRQLSHFSRINIALGVRALSSTGQVSLAAGSSSCSSCAVGFFANATGGCSACSPGSTAACMQNDTSAAGSVCPVGQYSAGTPRQCTLCPAGRYGDVPQSTNMCSGTCTGVPGRACIAGSTAINGMPCPPGACMSERECVRVCLCVCVYVGSHGW
jgi:hypothetical protein